MSLGNIVNSSIIIEIFKSAFYAGERCGENFDFFLQGSFLFFACFIGRGDGIKTSLFCVNGEMRGVYLRLRKIELNGFKSFADRTSLVFDAEIIAVVGPNGCGKSNIIDAFRWVMGEQSAKSMRGDKMHDVIFSGASKRKAANYAQVQLTFANADTALPIDYNEVSVSRRIYRSGESEYCINRNPVRLRDIQELFLGTGIGKGAFSVFEQGKIDQIILDAPEQRRYVFEEAAGILRFKRRKKEALQKLEQTQSNIERVRDIHGEVKRQSEALSKQAREASEYRKNKERLAVLDKYILFSRWKALKRKNEEYRSMLSDILQDKSKDDAAFSEWEVQREKIKKNLFGEEGKYQESKGRISRINREEEVDAAEERLIEERRIESDEREKKLALEQKVLKGRCLEREKILASFREKREFFQEKVRKEALHLGDYEKKAAFAEEKILKLREAQKTEQDRLFQLMERANRCSNRLEDNKVRLESTQEKIQSFSEKKKGLKFNSCLIEEKIRKNKLSVEQFSRRIDEWKSGLLEIEKEFKDISSRIRIKGEEQEEISKVISESKARHRVLTRLQEDREGFSSDTQKLLKESSRKKSELFGLLQALYELITPKEGGERSVAVVMRHYAQTLAVKTSEDRKKVLDFAKKKGLKDFSLFCMEDLREKGKPFKSAKGVRCFLDKVEKNRLTDHFFGRVSCLEGVDDFLSEKEKFLDLEVLFEDHMFMDHLSVISSFSLGEGSAFLREAEIKALSLELGERESLFERRGKDLSSLNLKKKSLEDSRFALDQKIRKEEMKLLEANLFLQGAMSDRDKIKEEMQEMEDQEVKEKLHFEKYVSTVKIAEGDLFSAKQEVEKCRFFSEEKDKSIGEEQKILEKLRMKYREREESFKDLREESSRISSSLNACQVQLQEWESRQKDLEKELLLAREAKDSLKKRGEEYRKKRRKREGELSEEKKFCEGIKKSLEMEKRRFESFEKKIHKYQEKARRLEGKKSDIDVKRARNLAGIESLEENILERYRMNMERVANMDMEWGRSLEEVEKELDVLRRKIERAGDVNMKSIEEYEQCKSRHEFLDRQLEDIGEAQKELLNIIAKLDRESRKAMKETLENVRINFKKNFEILFAGGEADLQLTESQDILNAGIEIIAKPPGKQMRSISLLSGGEKCMTAMALLFAIFEVKPAPFCLLDEIDAPLDDLNISRFVNVLKRFIDNTQFVIVTHNKRTMSEADVLFGVSMEEKGVSKLIALEFSKGEEASYRKESVKLTVD